MAAFCGVETGHSLKLNPPLLLLWEWRTGGGRLWGPGASVSVEMSWKHAVCWGENKESPNIRFSAHTTEQQDRPPVIFNKVLQPIWWRPRATMVMTSDWTVVVGLLSVPWCSDWTWENQNYCAHTEKTRPSFLKFDTLFFPHKACGLHYPQCNCNHSVLRDSGVFFSLRSSLCKPSAFEEFQMCKKQQSQVIMWPLLFWSHDLQLEFC